MTARKRRGVVAQPANRVTSIGARGNYRPSFSRVASGNVAALRAEFAMSLPEFTEWLASQLEWAPTPDAVERWEQGTTPPGDVVSACYAVSNGIAESSLPLLAAVSPAFDAAMLEGLWVTVYEFPSMGTVRYHADVATVTAETGNRIHAVNHPPEPRSEGRSVGFRNEIEATLAGRHLIGTYMNTSDTRYYGTVQLAVHSGETVMEGIFAGVGSDVEVSDGRWKWVRLDADPDEVAGIMLRGPVELYELVKSRTRNDEPLTLADIREES